MIDYFTILTIMNRFNKSLFDIPVSEQNKYLLSFSEPQDNLERSYFQYKCQIFFSSKLLILAQNLVAILLFPLVALFLLLKKNPQKKSQHEIVISIDGIAVNVIPKELKGQFFRFSEGNVLRFKDVVFCCKSLIRYPFSPFFSFKLMFNVSKYRYVIDCYNPRQIVVHSEFSFCSSALTLFCNMHDIQHVNMMHGEKLFYIRDSFFRFDKCFVWDPHYIYLFSQLRAYLGQFIVSVPDSLYINTMIYEDINKHVDYKYYLANQTEIELTQIVKSMLLLESYGFSILIRPHPRYTNMNILQKLIAKDKIESNADVSIEDSLSNCGNIISCYSTVLLQGLTIDKQIIIDDISNSNLYLKLKDMQFIALSKEFKFLSDIVRQTKI